MARRFSGNAVVTAYWSDDQGLFACRVSTPEGSVRVNVKPSPELYRMKAIDSSEGYDEIAKAALSFAESELEANDISLTEHAMVNPDGSGWQVSRRKDNENLRRRAE